MNKAARQLAKTRAARNAARTTFDKRLMQVKRDLKARSVGGRIADKIAEDARCASDQALKVASESKGIIAGTVAALALWLLRKRSSRGSRG